jgi:hypothetical protein
MARHAWNRLRRLEAVSASRLSRTRNLRSLLHMLPRLESRPFFRTVYSEYFRSVNRFFRSVCSPALFHMSSAKILRTI